MNEKMRVLDLLESGKITAEEASKLLEALGKPTLVSREARDNMEEKLQRFANDYTKLAKEVGVKVQELYKGVEPKLKKASQTALERVACVLEEVACSISESLEKTECCEAVEECCEAVEECCEAAAECCEEVAEAVEECCEDVAEELEDVAAAVEKAIDEDLPRYN